MTSARFEFRKALVDALTEDTALADVSVDYGWSGELRTREEIFLTETSGSKEVPVFTGPPTAANPLHYDDLFKFTVTCLAWKAGQSSEEADERGDALALVVERILREDPTLAADTAEWVVIAGTITDQRSITSRSKEGFTSTVEVDVEVHARIFGPAE